MKKSLIVLCAILTISALVIGCGSKTVTKEVALSEDVTAAIEDLYSYQQNYANGTALLNIIPVPTVSLIYDNWDDIAISGNDKAPIMLREYVDPSIVYFDYGTDYSIKWEKDSGNIVIEATDTAAREDYKQKQHK